MSLDEQGRKEFIDEFDRTTDAEMNVLTADYDAFLSWGAARLPAMFEELTSAETKLLWRTLKLTGGGT